MVTVIPNLYQLTLKLQRNVTKCDRRTDGRSDRQLSYYNIDYGWCMWAKLADVHLYDVIPMMREQYRIRLRRVKTHNFQ